MIVQLTLTVANVNSLLGLGFSRIEIFASTDEGSSYSEITSPAAQPAVLTSAPAASSFRMGGKQLRLVVNGGVEQSILFSTLTTYWSPVQVSARINDIVPGLTTTLNGSVVFSAPTTGRGSSLLITYNEAVDLGLPAGTRAYGTDARPVLATNQFFYPYTDLAGLSTNRYKWRFSANGSNPVSEFSERVFGNAAPMGSAPMSVGTALFVGLDGRAQKRRIVVVSDNAPAVIGGVAVGNELPITVDADDFGFLYVPLVQGARVRIAIEGTAYVREIVVPAAASFDILQAMAAAPDPFSVQVPPPFLIRRSF